MLLCTLTCALTVFNFLIKFAYKKLNSVNGNFKTGRRWINMEFNLALAVTRHVPIAGN